MSHSMSGSLALELRAAPVGANPSCRLLSTLEDHLLLQACCSVGAWQVAVRALERTTDLGIYAGMARYNMVRKWLCDQKAVTEAQQ